MSDESSTTATAGDVIVVSGHRVGGAERVGEILEVLGSTDNEHYRVRWDDGTESIFFPGSDAHVRHESTT